MPRIAESELERIKNGIDLAALVRSKGVELKKHGSKDLVGKCPFHKDDTASLIVTPSKNLWHCMGCGKGGSVIDFVMSHDGLSFRHAYEVLADGSAAKLVQSGKVCHQSTVPKLDNPLDAKEDAELMEQAIAYYQERLGQTPAALEYLRQRGISDEAVAHFGLGYADRTLGLRLPEKNRKDGAAIREHLQRIGLYRASGHEHFNGCVVFPIRNAGGRITEVYGRKTVQKQVTGIHHLYLPGPHVGLLNREAFKSREIILCESVIDALTFWNAGIKNVTTIYGTEGFTQELQDTLIKEKIRRVWLAYDRDEAGDKAALRDAERLGGLGMECYRVAFPHGMDANQYALKVQPAGKSLSLLIKSAEWLKGKASPQKSEPAPEVKDENPSDDSRVPSSLLAAKLVADDVLFEVGDRSYRARGLDKNPSLDTLKINLRVVRDDLLYLDTFDLYTAKLREHFIRHAAGELTVKEELIKRDVGRILLALEDIQERRLNGKKEEAAEVEMTPEERQEALELLSDPKLLERIVTDFEACGIVGEQTNKLTGYLAAVSRKLDRPLAIIIQSTSAAGKTSLMEAVLAMMPEDEKIKYSAMTGQSLYYLGETDLKHKILAIVEEEGAEKASYALKLLQSEGELTIASTGKDDTGRMKTEEYHVEGPVMIFLTTTAIDIDEELLNRCLVLTVDESREQTEAIHKLQREAETFTGLKRKLERERLLMVHKNAQRLLQPVNIINPYAEQLHFSSERTRTRRDHAKYLTLIKTVALLHQFQRERVTRDGIEYIEVTPADIRAANSIAHDVLGRSLDELPPQTRKLLIHLDELVIERCRKAGMERSDIHFSRREVRQFTGWSQTQLKLHLDRLVDLEYLAVHCGMRGSLYVYELLFDGDPKRSSAHLSGLIDIEAPELSGLNDELSGQKEKLSGANRPQNGGLSGGCRIDSKPDKQRVYRLKSASGTKKRTRAPKLNGVS